MKNQTYVFFTEANNRLEHLVTMLYEADMSQTWYYGGSL